MSRAVCAAAACLVLFGGPAALAQTPEDDPHAVQPQRPTVATHAGTVAPGWLEVEAGAERDRYADRSLGGAVPMLFKIGLVPRVQFEFLVPIVRPAGVDTTGIGDISLDVKWRFAEGAPLLGNVAILPSLKLPTGSANSGTGTGTTDVGLLLISSHDLGPVAMDLNVGYTRRGGNGATTPRNALLWTASFGGPARGWLGWVAEVYGYPATSGPAGAPPIVAFLAGPTAEIRKWLVIDAGIIVPMTGPQPRAVYAGVTYNVGRLWTTHGAAGRRPITSVSR